jgi:type III secretion protein L
MADEDKPRIIGGGKVIRGGSSAELPPMDKPALGPPPRRPGVVSAEDYEAKQTGNKIIEEAKRQADEIRAQAERDKQAVFDKAVEDARAQVAVEQGELILRTKMQIGEMMQAMERDVLDLALKISAKIIGRDLERDPMVVAEIAATAIEVARAAKAMILRVNPKDAQTLRNAKPKLMELIGRTLELSIRDDADVEPGGCIIQTEFGTIDAQIKTQYQMLENVLRPPDGKKEGPK